MLSCEQALLAALRESLLAGYGNACQKMWAVSQVNFCLVQIQTDFSLLIALMHVDIRLTNFTTRPHFENANCEFDHEQIPKAGKMKRISTWKQQEGSWGLRKLHANEAWGWILSLWCNLFKRNRKNFHVLFEYAHFRCTEAVSPTPSRSFNTVGASNLCSGTFIISMLNHSW